MREKIVAGASRRFVVVADESKQVDKLGRFPLPVEVIQMAAPQMRFARDHKPYVTDEGNFILDCSGLVIDDPDGIADKIDSIAGIVEHGLFLHMAELAVIAGEKQVIERTV